MEATLLCRLVQQSKPYLFLKTLFLLFTCLSRSLQRPEDNIRSLGADELQPVVIYLVWVLGAELWYPAITICTLNIEPSF